MKPVSFLSFDVEALPGRTDSDHVDRLMWGKLDGGEYGVKKICAILNEYGIKGNFLIDLAGCALYGDKPIREVGLYILSQGHELHAHLHSEWLIRSWGIKGKFSGPAGLNQLDEETNLIFLRYAYFKYRQLFGAAPEVFRGGAFMFNAHTIAAARDAGFKCLSNFNTQRHADMLGVDENNANNEPFNWGNGISEIPVDFSPEPLSFDIQKYFGWFDRVQDRKKIKTFNLTMHSWSLLKRQGDFFATAAPEHEERLRFICEHLCGNTQVCGYSEYLADNTFSPVSTNYFRFETAALDSAVSMAKCNVCGAKFSVRETDVCPGCQSRARHRQVVEALGKRGNPFDGFRVLACFANSVEKLTILAGAKEVLNFDVRPVSEADLQMDIQQMDAIADNSFDGFLALHVLNHVKDDRLALKEIQRVLRPGGVALVTIPYREGERTAEMSNVLEHYGAENYAKYGVGSYRRYGLDDVVNLFATLFEVDIINGHDSITNQIMNVFLLKKRPVLTND